jgi:hypothetical protein
MLFSEEGVAVFILVQNYKEGISITVLATTRSSICGIFPFITRWA